MNSDAAQAYIRQKTRKVSEYFKPTENVRVRDFVREVPGAVGQMFSGTRDFVNTSGKIMGEGLAYATDRNVREQYKAGNTNILPTISEPNAGRRLFGNAAKSFTEIATAGKIPGLSKMAMSARLAPRLAAGGAMGYGYGVADEVSKPGPVNRETFTGMNPIMSALAGALLGGASRPAAEGIGQSIREMGNDIRNINPKNRMRHQVVGVSDMEPTGIYAAGGIPQMGENPHTYRQEVKTTVDPFEPKSYLARVLMGKQSPMGMSIKAESPLLQEAGKYKSAEEFVKAQGKTYYHATDANFDNFNPSMNPDDVGTWFAGNKANVLDPEVAKTLPIVKEQVLKPGTKLITEEQLSRFEKTPFVLNSRKPIHELLMEKGYRGIRYAGDDIQLFEPNIDTISKSQLTDLYNKAHKK